MVREYDRFGKPVVPLRALTYSFPLRRSGRKGDRCIAGCRDNEEAKKSGIIRAEQEEFHWVKIQILNFFF